MLRGACLLIALLTAACAPQAPLTVSDPVYRPPLGAAPIGVAYGELRAARADTVVGVESAGAEAVEIHATVREGSMSRMERLDQLKLPDGETVALTPGGLHLMIIRPRPAAEDEGLPITFRLQSGASVTVAFPVESRP
jgi:periplasmic copper chaperone A